MALSEPLFTKKEDHFIAYTYTWLPLLPRVFDLRAFKKHPCNTKQARHAHTCARPRNVKLEALLVEHPASSCTVSSCYMRTALECMLTFTQRRKWASNGRDLNEAALCRSAPLVSFFRHYNHALACDLPGNVAALVAESSVRVEQLVKPSSFP